MANGNPEFYTTSMRLRDDINGDKFLRVTLSIGRYGTSVTAEIGTQVGWKMSNGVKVPDIDWKAVGQSIIEGLVHK
jgi:hypothetical protein